MAHTRGYHLVFFAVLAFYCALALTQSLPADAAPARIPEGFRRVKHADGFNQATAFAFQGQRIFVAEKNGAVRVILPDGTLRAKPYLMLKVSTNYERGLLGIAVDPRFKKNKFVYVYYTTGPGAKNYSGTPVNRVSRFVNKGGVGKQEKILLDNIPSDTGYHNGGDLHFGFDGKLYVTTGDGGLYKDAVRLVDNFRGKVLRLNRDGSAPGDNPFVGTVNAQPQIYAMGFRNPFRLAPRWENSSYLVGDVGYNDWEEIDSLQAGADYGWSRYEGPCPSETLNCDPAQTNFGATTPPIHYYNHTTGDEKGVTIIVGGFAGKDSNYPAPYKSAMFYADFSFAWIHTLELDATNRVVAQRDFDFLSNAIAFVTGPDGNVYVLRYSPGEIYKYVYRP